MDNQQQSLDDIVYYDDLRINVGERRHIHKVIDYLKTSEEYGKIVLYEVNKPFKLDISFSDFDILTTDNVGNQIYFEIKDRDNPQTYQKAMIQFNRASEYNMAQRFVYCTFTSGVMDIREVSMDEVSQAVLSKKKYVNNKSKKKRKHKRKIKKRS